MKSRLFLAVVFLYYTSALCEGGILQKTTVTITNALVPNTALTLHCKSKDDDLGVHVLQKGESFSFKFKVNFWKTTLFYCYFQWMSNGTAVSKWFDIFQPSDGCKHCDWEVYLTGPCLMKGSCYTWDKHGLSFKSSMD